MHRLFIVWLPMLLAACEIPPRFIEDSSEVDAFLSQKRYRSACVGLTASKDSVREYTAGRLGEMPHIRAATECVCAAIYDAEGGTFDASVAKGLEASHRDDLAACLSPALDDSRIAGDDRADLVRAIGGLDAKGAYGALEALVLNDPDPAVRAQAAEGVRPSEAAVPTLVEALTTDKDATVRAAAAAALDGRKGDEVVAAITNAALTDEDGGVRGAALKSSVRLKLPKTDDMICTAMLEDTDERVRLSAVEAWHGTKRKKPLDCIQARMKKKEESGAVRTALLKALGASPSDIAAKMLCDNVGGWVRLYVHDKVAYEIEGADIVRTQNDRDWERSYDCVGKAISQGGYSCFGRNYLGHWMKDLGGKASTPQCAGMRAN